MLCINTTVDKIMTINTTFQYRNIEGIYQSKTTLSKVGLIELMALFIPFGGMK